MTFDLPQIVRIENEAAMYTFAEKLATQVKSPCIIYLQGELGAGKTTLTRGFLRALGYEGKVKSPTFTLVETYDIDHKKIFHVDLYRLTDPDELEFLGLSDYFTEDAIGLIEWPERGAGYLPPPDIICRITIEAEQRVIQILVKP